MLNNEFLLRLRTRLWEEREAGPRHEKWLVHAGRNAFALVRDLMDGQLSMRAMSLVYTTLLSIVPLLALGFSVLKALGVHNSLEPVLLEFLRPLGPQGAEITQNIIGFVEKIQVGVLGSLGVALLIYTAISLIQKVEGAFNFIWRIDRARPFAQRVGEYLGVLMVGPVVIFSAIGITASVRNSAVVSSIVQYEPFGTLFFTLGGFVPYLMIAGMFTFLYSFMPNTRVQLRAAAIGGVIGGVMWQTSSIAFASFVGNASNYSAIYSGFAIVIFLLIWVYVSWLILLIGCQLAFYAQHPEHVKPQRLSPLLAGRHAEYLSLMIMGVAARRFIAGEPPLAQEDYSRQLHAEPSHVERAVETLLQAGFLLETGQLRNQLAPARDLDSITLGDIWHAVRDGGGGKPRDALGREVLRLLEEAERSFIQSSGQLTLREWLQQVTAK